MAFNHVLKATTDSELLSYIINTTPELASDIDLPVQGESIKPIGQLIMNNERYRNAFINTVNLIGLTVIKRNGWDNPWYFTKRGQLRLGQQIRELVIDLCNVYDYNENINDKTRFTENVVPNLFNYIHEVNFQKFYEQTVRIEQMQMAFDTDGGLFNFVEECILMLYESLKYDTYIVDKYMLCRRILDGTVTSVQIADYDELTNRQKVSAIKSVSNKMIFRSGNYNPAGIRKATSFSDQMVIVNTDFEADYSTDVMATSYFRSEAELKSNMVLIDGFNNHDIARLEELLGDAYVEFTQAELDQLANIPAVIISKEWFMDYDYMLDNASETKQTEFTNPTTLDRNIFLHAWRVFSTSPFENACVFSKIAPSVTSVTVNPSTATVNKGQSLQLTATVVTTGFANKGVQWSVTQGEGVTVDLNGKVTIPADFSATGTGQVKVKATSIYNSSKSATATITVV